MRSASTPVPNNSEPLPAARGAASAWSGESNRRATVGSTSAVSSVNGEEAETKCRRRLAPSIGSSSARRCSRRDRRRRSPAPSSTAPGNRRRSPASTGCRSPRAGAPPPAPRAERRGAPPTTMGRRRHPMASRSRPTSVRSLVSARRRGARARSIPRSISSRSAPLPTSRSRAKGSRSCTSRIVSRIVRVILLIQEAAHVHHDPSVRRPAELVGERLLPSAGLVKGAGSPCRCRPPAAGTGGLPTTGEHAVERAARHGHDVRRVPRDQRTHRPHEETVSEDRRTIREAAPWPGSPIELWIVTIRDGHTVPRRQPHHDARSATGARCSPRRTAGRAAGARTEMGSAGTGSTRDSRTLRAARPRRRARSGPRPMEQKSNSTASPLPQPFAHLQGAELSPRSSRLPNTNSTRLRRWPPPRWSSSPRPRRRARASADEVVCVPAHGSDPREGRSSDRLGRVTGAIRSSKAGTT